MSNNETTMHAHTGYMTSTEIDRIERAAKSPDPQAMLLAVKACHNSCINQGTHTRLWCAAMTIAYGPSNLHPSRCDENGYPLAEALASFPNIVRAMEEARARVPYLISVARRQALGTW